MDKLAMMHRDASDHMEIVGPKAQIVEAIEGLIEVSLDEVEAKKSAYYPNDRYRSERDEKREYARICLSMALDRVSLVPDA